MHGTQDGEFGDLRRGDGRQFHGDVHLSGLDRFHGFAGGQEQHLAEILLGIKPIGFDPAEEVEMHGAAGSAHAEGLALEILEGADARGLEGVGLGGLHVQDAHAAHVPILLLVGGLAFPRQWRVLRIEHGEIGLALLQPVDALHDAGGGDRGNADAGDLLRGETRDAAAYGEKASAHGAGGEGELERLGLCRSAAEGGQGNDESCQCTLEHDDPPEKRGLT